MTLSPGYDLDRPGYLVNAHGVTARQQHKRLPADTAVAAENARDDRAKSLSGSALRGTNAVPGRPGCHRVSVFDLRKVRQIIRGYLEEIVNIEVDVRRLVAQAMSPLIVASSPTLTPPRTSSENAANASRSPCTI